MALKDRWLSAGDPGLVPGRQIDEALHTVRSVDAGDPTVAAACRSILELAQPGVALADRTTRPGHLTGSAIVFDEAGDRTLLMLHRKLGIWVQPGGHADGDMNLAGVAFREATEETGLAGLLIDPIPIDLDVHRVAPPNEDAHLHLDVRFLVIAPAGAVPAPNHESRDMRWVDPSEIADLGADAGLERLVAAGLRRLRASNSSRSR